MAQALHRSWVEISRERIASNFRAVRAAVGADVEVMPVVKADAYRHGAVEVSRVLAEEGAHWLAVSNVEEGVVLREAGIAGRILVMADFLSHGRTAMLDHDLTPVLHSLEDIATLDRLSSKRDKPVRYHLKIDSGMGRLGCRAKSEQIAEAVLAARSASLEGIMTHFASVTDFSSQQTAAQTEMFHRLCLDLGGASLRPRYTHMASTGAIAYGLRSAWGNLVRPGHAIYGYTSPARGAAPPNALQVEPALSWKAAVLAVKDVEAGALIGYGGMYRASGPMRIAVLAVGYADGLPHRLSNRGRVIVNGRYAQILGAVSMDVTTIDATSSPELRAGDAVTLLGREGDARIDAQDMARVAGTISYNVLCAISSRVKRVYV